jgi:hypothetical protein
MKLAPYSLLILFIGSLLTLFVGCGGGTIGTDDGATLKVSGTVVDANGQIVSDALVIVESTGDSSRSDQQGRFELTTSKITESRFRIDATVGGRDVSITSEPVIFSNLLETQSFAITISVDSVSVSVEEFEISPVAPIATATPGDIKTRPLPTPQPQSVVRAVVRDQFDQLLEGVEVTVEGERSTTTSKRNGTFEVNFLSTRKRLGLLLKYKGQRARISLEGLPGEPALLRLGIVIKTPDPELAAIQKDNLLDVAFNFQVRAVRSSNE